MVPDFGLIRGCQEFRLWLMCAAIRLNAAKDLPVTAVQQEPCRPFSYLFCDTP